MVNIPLYVKECAELHFKIIGDSPVNLTCFVLSNFWKMHHYFVQEYSLLLLRIICHLSTLTKFVPTPLSPLTNASISEVYLQLSFPLNIISSFCKKKTGYRSAKMTAFGEKLPKDDISFALPRKSLGFSILIYFIKSSFGTGEISLNVNTLGIYYIETLARNRDMRQRKLF